MRRHLRRVVALPVIPFCDGEHGTSQFPYDALYIGLLIAQAVAVAVWVVYSPI
jgi:hypothetical protein